MSVMSWVRTHIIDPRPSGPERLLRSYRPGSDTPIHRDACVETESGWRLETRGRRSFRLFELREPVPGACLLTYRARVQSRGVHPCAYLEMWCHVPDEGEYVARSPRTALRGDRGWQLCEARYVLKPGQRPDAIKLNLAFAGPGVIDIRDIRLTATPLARAGVAGARQC